MSKVKKIVAPYFISMQGCKNSCIYCNQPILKEHQNKESVTDLIERYLGYLKPEDKINVELAFFGGTFLNLPQKKINSFLKEAEQLKKHSKISEVRISTTPDSISFEKCSLIKDVVDTVELGVQSLDNNLLKLIGRKYDSKAVIEATHLLKKLGFKVCLQIMTGLPYETFNSFKKTVSIVCELKPDFTRIYPVIVLKNTALANYHKLDIYKTTDKEEVIKRIAYALYAFHLSNIRVIRVGLDSFVKAGDAIFTYSEDDWKGKAVSFLWRELITQEAKENALSTLTLCCNPNDYQHIVGSNRSNIRYFLNNGLNVKVIQDDTVGSDVYIQELDAKTGLAKINWSLVNVNYAS